MTRTLAMLLPQPAFWALVACCALLTTVFALAGAPWYTYAALAVVVLYGVNLARALYHKGMSEALYYVALAQTYEELAAAQEFEADVLAATNGHLNHLKLVDQDDVRG